MLVPEEGPRFIVTRDGVVVAVGDALGGHGDADGVRLVGGGEPLMHAGRLDLTVCTPADPAGVDVGGPLPEGQYELTALMDVTRIPFEATPEHSPDRDASRDVELADVPGAEPVTVGADEPLPFSVTGGPYDPAGPPPDVPVELSQLGSPDIQCSGPAPSPTGPGGLFRLTPEYRPDEGPVTFAADEPVNLPAELSYPWAGVVEGVLEHRVDYWVVQDSVVVGRGWPGATDDWWSLLTMRGGAIGPQWLSSEWLLESCADEPVGTLYIEPFGSETEWTPLSAGEYQVFRTTSVLVGSVTTARGTVTAPDGTVPYLVVADPETIVVE
ncbi:MAG: hypothetical protein JWP95_543 [Actinotalea sp.]|nr:hypothetical protein [Actinotalea sp.]